MSFACGALKSGPPPNDSERFYLKVNNDEFVKKLFSIYSELDIKNGEHNFDARTQILVHLNNKTDTICMGRMSGIVINGRMIEDSTVLFNLVNNEINKNYKPILNKQ